MKFKIAGFIMSCIIFMPAHAVLLDVNSDGILEGAVGIVIGDNSYDVEFVDGTCLSVFTGCDEDTDFAFTDQSVALAAAEALLDQVIIGVFDESPELTFGCSGARVFGGGICQVIIPNAWEPTPEGGRLRTATANFGDRVDWTSTWFINGQDLDTNAFPAFVYARFSLSSPSQVPAPGTAILLLLGLAGLSLFRRGKKS